MKHKRSGLFLMELILAILFFSLAGTVCIQLFVKAYLTGQQSSDVSQAVLWAQTLAEAFYGGTPDTLSEKAGMLEDLLAEGQQPVRGGTDNDISLSFYLDEDWDVPEAPGRHHVVQSGRYTAMIRLTQDASFYYADVSVHDQKKEAPLYTLSLKQYRPERRSR